MYRLEGTCVEPPFDYKLIDEMVANGRRISYREFEDECVIDDVEVWGTPLREAYAQHPHDFEFFVSKVNGKRVFYFTHSGVEFIFMPY